MKRIKLIYIDPAQYDCEYYRQYIEITVKPRRYEINPDEFRWNKIKNIAQKPGFLTQKQYAVFCGFAAGMNGKEIGDKLGVSKMMISLVKRDIIRKLQKHFKV